MQAAIGLVQLRKLDDILERKRANADWMNQRLAHVPGITTPYAHADRGHGYAMYSILVERDRDRVLESLLAHGIESRVYFPPVHRQPVFSGSRADVPVTDWVAERVLSVPFHSRLTFDAFEEIAGTIEASLEDVRV
jgi:perosamine synthetase